MHIKLRPRQRVFADHYHLTGNMREAGAVAGYNCKPEHFRKVLDLPAVKNYLANLDSMSAQKMNITKEWKLKKLKRCADMSMPDDDVNDLSEKEYRLISAPAAINAVQEMNKMQGDYAAPPEKESKELITIDDIKDMLEAKQKPF